MQPSSGTIPNLNGMRALAVGFVIVAHSGLAHIVPGGFGVTVFFVLSGFLITTLLIRERERTGTLSLSKFYARRALRLMPPLYIVTALAVLGVLCGALGGSADPWGIAALLLYAGNYFLLFAGGDLVPHGLGIVWSLAVEEHFYLLWPPLLLWLFLRGVPRPRLGHLLVAASAVTLAWRVILSTWLDPPAFYIEYATDTRVDSLLAGCWLALVRNPWLDPPPAAANRHRDHLLLAACLALLLLSLVIRDPLFRDTLRYTFQNVALVGVFWLVVARASDWPFRYLSHPVADYVGRISYGLYLTHMPLLFAFERWFPDQPALLRALPAIAIALVLCELMRRWVDEPIASMRSRLQAGPPTVPAADLTTGPGVSRPS